MTISARAQYAYGVGLNVALASLKNVENTVAPNNRSLFGSKRYPVVIWSPPLDFFPVRDATLDDGERGGGNVNTEWNMTLYTYGLQFWLNTIFSNQTVTEAAVTIYTRDMFASYARYNATAILPSLANGDLAPLRGGDWAGFRGAFRVRQRLYDLQAL